MRPEPVACAARPTCVKASSLLGSVVLAAGVCACGTQAYSQPAGPPAPATVTPVRTAVASARGSVSPATIPPGASPPAGVVTRHSLTAADNGATVPLHPGQRVTVTLARQGMFSWHVPAATDGVVRKISGSGGYPGNRPARAVFRAVRPGRVTLTAIEDAACLHAHPACLLSQQPWRVTIVVSPFIPPADGGPATPAP